MEKTKVVIANRESRRENLLSVLNLLKDDIREEIGDKERVVIKPNFVNINVKQSATPKETVETILEFLKPIYHKPITIAEGSGIGDSMEGFRKFGYLELKERYNLRFVDLNKDKTKKVMVFDQKLEKNLPQDIAKTILDSDFLISPALMKTHNSVTVTLGLKNILVGALKQKYQFDYGETIHQGYQAINRSLFELAKLYHPHLTIIDGWQMMEGSGPSHGNLVKGKIALASLNFLAPDLIACYLMGFDPNDVGYLYYCSKHWNLTLNDIEVVGVENWQKLRKKLKPHPKYQEQMGWR